MCFVIDDGDVDDDSGDTRNIVVLIWKDDRWTLLIPYSILLLLIRWTNKVFSSTPGVIVYNLMDR
jgi:hypothetical protein